MSVFTNMEIVKTENAKGAFRGYGKVTVSGVMEVRFSVLDGKNGVWAKLPTEKDKEKKNDSGFPVEYPQVKFTDETVQKEFQDMVRSTYTNAGNKFSNSSKPKAVDNIPF